MIITLDQDEIGSAVEAQVQTYGVDTEGKIVNVTFTMGKGANGLSAAIEVTENSPVKQRRRRRSKRTEESEEVLNATDVPEAVSADDDEPADVKEFVPELVDDGENDDESEEQEQSLFGDD